MALQINDTTYAGEVLEGFISLATTGFDTAAAGCMNVIGGIKKSKTIPSVSVKNFIQARKATPNHGGQASVNARKLAPKDFMGYLEFNPRDFEDHWWAVQMNPKLLDAELPRTAESAIIQEVLKLNAEYMDEAVWQSVYDSAAVATAVSNGLGDNDNRLIFFDGFLKRMIDATDTIRIPSGQVEAITVANIFDKFNLVSDSRPKAIQRNKAGRYLVSYRTAQLYQQALQAQVYKGAQMTEEGTLRFSSRDIVPLAGMPDDTIVYCVATTGMDTNLWMGVNEIDEEEHLMLNKLQNNSELWFLKMLYKIDVNIAFPEELVLYTAWGDEEDEDEEQD